MKRLVGLLFVLQMVIGQDLVVGTDPNRLWPGNVEPRVGYDIGNGLALDAKDWPRILFHEPPERKEYWIEQDKETGEVELMERTKEWWEK